MIDRIVLQDKVNVAVPDFYYFFVLFHSMFVSSALWCFKTFALSCKST